MSTFKGLVMVIIWVVFATGSFAQNIPNFDNSQQHNLSKLLNIAGVQQELEMTERQKLMLMGSENGPSLAMQDAWVKYKSNLDPADTEEQKNQNLQEFRNRIQQIAKKEKEKLDKILLSHQMERMQEIKLQLLGDQIWFIKDVQQSIGVTPIQAKKIQQVVKTSRKEAKQKQSAVPRESSKRMRDAANKEIELIQKQSEKKIKDLLSSEQKKKLKKMLGDKFEIAVDRDKKKEK